MVSRYGHVTVLFVCFCLLFRILCRESARRNSLGVPIGLRTPSAQRNAQGRWETILTLSFSSLHDFDAGSKTRFAPC